MSLVDSIASNACRNAVFHAYLSGKVHAEHRARDRPAHRWGLCAALSSRYLSRGVLRRGPELWAELAPFFLVRNEQRAVGALAEYVVFQEYPPLADIEWLGLEINEALAELPEGDASVTEGLARAVRHEFPAWLALLSYETLRKVRRFVDTQREVPPRAEASTVDGAG